MQKRKTTNIDTSAEDNARAPVSRRAVMDDLRRMILAAADHLALIGPKNSCVNDFLGFKAGPWKVGHIPQIDPAKVDLSRYALTELVNRAYDFAWQVGPRQNRIEMAEDTYLSMVTYIYSATPFMSDSCNTPMSLRRGSALSKTLETAWARQHLSWGGSLSVKDLAHLAQMTEPAVRASLSKEGIQTTGEKNENGLLGVEHEIALRWLEGRRGYVPTEYAAPMDGAYLDGEISQIFEQQGWGEVVHGPVRIIGLSTLAEMAKVDADWLLDVIMGGAATPDTHALERVGQHVSDDVPRFVGFAVEKMLRAGNYKEKRD